MKKTKEEERRKETKASKKTEAKKVPPNLKARGLVSQINLVYSGISCLCFDMIKSGKNLNQRSNITIESTFILISACDIADVMYTRNTGRNGVINS